MLAAKAQKQADGAFQLGLTTALELSDIDNKRFFAAQVLTEQPWIHDQAKTVGQALEEAGAEVLEFERLALA